MTRMAYETSGGETFDLSGVSSGITGAELRGWELTRSGRAYARQQRSCTATISFVGYGEEAHESAMRMLELCDRDAREGTPGRLHVGEWYITCYITAGGNAVWDHGHLSYDVTLVADDTSWCREVTRSFLPSSGSQISNEQLDYSHDYPHDYGARQSVGTKVEVPGIEPCDFRITVYGYALAPYVRVNSNVYQVNVTVPEGGLLVIDSTRKSSMAGDAIVLSDMYGNSQNAFDKRLRGSEGSGSYVFQRIEPGLASVTWPQGFGFDLTLIERRGRLPWT